LILAGLLHNTENKYGDAYNFGPQPNDHLTVKELLEIVLTKWEGVWKDVSLSNKPHESAVLELDISSAIEQLKWIPKLSASQAIQWTIDWYKKPLSKQAAYTFEQIDNYLAL
jgi:CDP-glucose 4,6-dehydratase